MKESFRCFLKILSPVHVGCDEVYEPMGFTIDEKTQEMVVFDPFSLISQMPGEDKQKFSDICDEPYQHLSQWKQTNQRKVIACYPMYVPEEIIHASGALPFVIQRSTESYALLNKWPRELSSAPATTITSWCALVVMNQRLRSSTF